MRFIDEGLDFARSNDGAVVLDGPYGPNRARPRDPFAIATKRLMTRARYPNARYHPPSRFLCPAHILPFDNDPNARPWRGACCCTAFDTVIN